MNMHVASDSIVAEEPMLTARLPGESDEDTEDVEGSEPEETIPDGRGPTGKGRRVNRKVLLAGVAVVAVVAGFLASPYSRLVPLPRPLVPLPWVASPARAPMPQAGGDAAPLAPSASLAQVALPPSSGPAVRERYVGQPPSQQVSEVLALRAGAPSSTPSSERPIVASPPAPPPAHPPAAAAPAAPPAPGADAASEPPPGFVPHEPGAGSVEQGAAQVSLVVSAGSAGRDTTAESAPPSPPAPLVASAGSGQDATSPSAGPSAASPAPDPSSTAAPVLAPTPTGDITRHIMTQVTASLDLKPFEPPAAPAEPAAASAPPAPAPVQSVSPSAAARPAEPVHAPTVSEPSRASVVSAPGASSPSSPSAAASDAAQIAASLHPAPMTPEDQVPVLELVTKLATMVADLKKENAQMRADLAKSQAEEAARVADWERRLALAEARGAMRAADAAASTPLVVTASAAAAGKQDSAPSNTVSATSSPTTAVVLAAGDAGKKYRLQAASPGLAMLAQIDRGGGEGAQIQVAVGDTVPGYGRVKAVTQHGTAWVVETDHGPIE